MKLYHYTLAETLLKMLEESIMDDDSTGITYLELWAFPASNMPDKNEYRLFTDKLKEKINEYAQKCNHTFAAKELEALEKLCQCHLYTISFTDKYESQYMWEHYGANHAGICIEFDLDAIPPFYCSKDGRLIMEDAYNSMLTRCKYVQPERLEIEEDLITNIYQYIISRGDSNVVKDAAILARLENTAIAYKTTNFSQESEFRFVLGCIKSEDHLKCSIPISAITSIILGASIKEAEEIKLITQKILETLENSVEVRISESLVANSFLHY